MKPTSVALGCIVLLASTSFAQRFTLDEKGTIYKTLEFARGAATKTLDVENVMGFIHVTGYDGASVEMTANKTIRARSQDRIEAARREVMLDIADQADRIRIFVNHPGRCRDGNNSNGCFNWSDDQYSVRFDFEIRVPKDTALRLRTINAGDIHVQGVTNDFDVEHINGAIEMMDVSGSGRAKTINGPVRVSFAGNPTRDSRFESLNGTVEVKFQPGFSADLRFETLHGGVYTDFPATALPTSTSSRHTVRMGNGGPQIRFETLNGNIKILQAK